MKKFLLLAGICVMALCANAQNPFTYDMTQTKSGQVMTVNYKLNAPATALKFKIYDAEGNLKYAHNLAVVSTDTLVSKGKHTVTVDLPELEPGTYSWSLSAANDAYVSTPKELGSPYPYQFWSPYGIAVDNNTDSKHFGRILVTEAQSNMASTYWTAADGVGAGLYEFDPQGNAVAKADGKNGYNPLNFTQFKYKGGAASNVFHNKKVRIAKDGRIFVGVLNTVDNPLYTVDADDLSKWTPVFGGTHQDSVGYQVDAEGEMIASPSAAFDVVGSGDNLKLVNLGCKFGQSYSYGSYTCYEYALGANSTWNTAAAAADEVIPYSLQYTISSQSVTVAYDEDGNGMWYAQYRGAPTDAQPAIKHATKSADEGWTEDYSDITSVVRGGGIAWNHDYTILAFPTANNTLNFYSVAKDDNGKPTLTKLYTASTTGIRGFNDICFDVANNVYVCDNGKEVLEEIQLPYPAVKQAGKKKAAGITEANTCEVPAPASQAIVVPVPTAVKDINTDKANTVKKVIENGRIVIINGDNKYDVMGAQIK